jgi:transposase
MIPAHLVEQLPTALGRWDWPLPQPMDARGGRPRKVDDADAAKARSLREKAITATDIAKTSGVSRATVYRYLSDGAPLPV